MSTKTCPKCNEVNPGHVLYCAACGTSLADVPVAQVAESIPVKSQPGAMDETTLETFIVYEAKAFKKGPPWTVNLTPTQAEFISQETNRRFSISREKAHSEIKFAKAGLFMTEGTVANVSGVSFNFGGNKSRLERWFPPKTADDMKKDLRGWGIGLIIIGLLSIILSKLLDPVWGAVIIVLGILNLLIIHRAMFIINGLALMVVGVLNILSICSALSSYSSLSTGWVIFGIMQIAWGVQEIGKFSKYASAR